MSSYKLDPNKRFFYSSKEKKTINKNIILTFNFFNELDQIKDKFLTFIEDLKDKEFILALCALETMSKIIGINKIKNMPDKLIYIRVGKYTRSYDNIKAKSLNEVLQFINYIIGNIRNDLWGTFDVKKHNFISKVFPMKGNLKVLDIGGGSGTKTLSYLLAYNDCKFIWYNLDINDFVSKKTKKIAKKNNIKYKFIENTLYTSGKKLSFDYSYDLVICDFSLHHICNEKNSNKIGPLPLLDKINSYRWFIRDHDIEHPKIPINVAEQMVRMEHFIYTLAESDYKKKNLVDIFDKYGKCSSSNVGAVYFPAQYLIDYFNRRGYNTKKIRKKKTPLNLHYILLAS